jgi:exopolyphosphatase/guanosine-5'-triphosphate,3'-diphosphate pyrophosphatase
VQISFGPKAFSEEMAGPAEDTQMNASTSRSSVFLLFLCGFVIAGATTSHAAAEALIRKRCAFDIGSGETKVSAAEVSSTESSVVIARLMDKRIVLPFVKRSKNGVIPDFFIEEATAKINELKRECQGVGAREYSGVATAGFRMARNGQEALAKISQQTTIPLQLIAAEQEAVLAFLAARSALGSNSKNLVVWDIGGGSLQFSMGADGPHRDFVISTGHEGVEMFRRKIARRFNRDPTLTVNPLTQEEMGRAIELARELSDAVNPQIRERLRRRSMRVVGLGSVHAESLAAQAGLQSNRAYNMYTLEGVRVAAKRAANMSDQDFRKAYPENKYPDSQATNVALVLGYMEGLQIKEVIPLELTLADGLLVDETYWSKEKLK